MINKIIYLFLVPLLSGCALFYRSPQKEFNINSVQNPFDAIIVPGVPFEHGKWSDVMKIRVHWAKYQFDQGLTRNIIFSGSAVYSPYYEAEIMAEYARKLGVPDSVIFVEKRAEHSVENVYYSYRIAKENNFKNVALSTDPYQSNSMHSFIKQHELPIAYSPIVFDTLEKLKMDVPSIDTMKFRQNDFTSLVERETFFERLGGTFGKNIQWHKEDLRKRKHFRRYEGRIIE